MAAYKPVSVGGWGGGGEVGRQLFGYIEYILVDGAWLLASSLLNIAPVQYQFNCYL